MAIVTVSIRQDIQWQCKPRIEGPLRPDDFLCFMSKSLAELELICWRVETFFTHLRISSALGNTKKSWDEKYITYRSRRFWLTSWFLFAHSPKIVGRRRGEFRSLRRVRVRSPRYSFRYSARANQMYAIVFSMAQTETSTICRSAPGDGLCLRWIFNSFAAQVNNETQTKIIPSSHVCNLGFKSSGFRRRPMISMIMYKQNDDNV